RRAQELDPLDHQVDDDRHRDRTEEQAEGPADRQPDAVGKAPGGAAVDLALAMVGAGRVGMVGRGDRRARQRRVLHRWISHGIRYLRIERRAVQPAMEKRAAEKSRTAAIENRVALKGGELSWSM